MQHFFEGGERRGGVVKTGFCLRDFGQTNEQLRRFKEQPISKLHGEVESIQTRARIFKRLWSPEIDSKGSIPPAYVAWRAGTITLFLLGS